MKSKEAYHSGGPGRPRAGAVWATRAGGGERGAGPPRTVDVCAYRDVELAGRDRVTVSGSDDRHLVTRQRRGADAEPGPPFACDAADLAELLAGKLALEQA
jgi:hypothetical protein